MSRLTEVDYETLARLSIRTVCDLRTTYERQAEPNTWCSTVKVSYWTRDYDGSLGELSSLLSSGPLTAEATKSAMLSVYKRLPFEQAPAYRELFIRLAAGETPLVFNCAAGKDRTGIAAALILLALQVPRSIVFDDYLLTNEVLNPRHVREHRAHERSSSGGTPEGVIKALMSADADYLDTALQAIEDGHGSVGRYLRDELGVSDENLERVRLHLLE
jgi:protein-tyrosine phosphatase